MKSHRKGNRIAKQKERETGCQNQTRGRKWLAEDNVDLKVCIGKNKGL